MEKRGTGGGVRKARRKNYLEKGKGGSEGERKMNEIFERERRKEKM